MMDCSFDKLRYKVDRNKPHNAQAVAIACVDHRFRKEINDWLTDVFGSADLVSLAGGAQNLIPEHARFGQALDLVLGNMEICKKLHHVKTVVLLIHSDCGAYGGLAEFNNDFGSEKKFFEQELAVAYRRVKEKFPDVEIMKIIFGFNGPEIVR